MIFLESQPPATHSPACVMAEPTQLKVGSSEIYFAGKHRFPILPQGFVKHSGIGRGGRIRLRLIFLESQPPATHSPACVMAEPTQLKVGSSEIYFAGKHRFPILPQGFVKHSGVGRGGRIRTYACTSQSRVPYRLATPLYCATICRNLPYHTLARLRCG